MKNYHIGIASILLEVIVIIKKTDDIVKEIKKIQNQKNITDEKLAYYAGVSKATVSHLLSGKSQEFTFKTLLKLAKGLDCTLDLSFK